MSFLVVVQLLAQVEVLGYSHSTGLSKLGHSPMDTLVDKVLVKASALCSSVGLVAWIDEECLEDSILLHKMEDICCHTRDCISFLVYCGSSSASS